jgi:hypothetical protein
LADNQYHSDDEPLTIATISLIMLRIHDKPSLGGKNIF